MSMTNKIENILIASVTALVAIALTVTIMELTSIATLKSEIKRQETRIDKQNGVIEELAKIEKYKIENKFDDVKAKDGQVVVTLDNKLDALTTGGQSADTIPGQNVKQKKTFWQKLKFW